MKGGNRKKEDKEAERKNDKKRKKERKTKLKKAKETNRKSKRANYCCAALGPFGGTICKFL